MHPESKIDKLADELAEIVAAYWQARYETGDRTLFDKGQLALQFRRTVRDSCSELWEESAAESECENLRQQLADERLKNSLLRAKCEAVSHYLDEAKAEASDLREQLAAAQQRAELLNVALRLAIGMAEKAWGHWDRDEDSKVGKILQALAGKLPRYCPDTDIIHSNLVQADALAKGTPCMQSSEQEDHAHGL